MPGWSSARPNGSSQSPRRPPRSPSSPRRRSRDSATARWPTSCASVRGMYVTDDRNFSYVGIRGFGKPGDYNSRILLLINGHRVNDNIFGQAEIGPEFGLDPAMFDRVEIIRGPGIVALRRQRVLCRRQRHHPIRRVARRRFGHPGDRHAGDAAGARQRRSPPGERRGRRRLRHLRAERRRWPALFSGLRHAGHQQRHRRGTRWRRRRATLRPADLQGTGRDRRLRNAAAGRADGLGRHACSTSRSGASRRPTVTRSSMRSMGARSAARG